jgi:hypothetical protein
MDSYNLSRHSPKGYTTFGGTGGRDGVSSWQHVFGRSEESRFFCFDTANYAALKPE